MPNQGNLSGHLNVASTAVQIRPPLVLTRRPAPAPQNPMIARRTLLFALVALVAVTTALEANPSAATAETKTAEAAATPPAYPFMYPWMGMYPYMGLYHMWMMPWMWGFPYYGFPYFY